MSPESKSLVNRLRGSYPVGPIMENGEPEFGYRDMFGPNVTAPGIDLEAATHIEKLEAELVELRSDRNRLNHVAANPQKYVRHHKRHWSFIGLTSYPYTAFKTLREAIDASINNYPED